MIASPYCDDGSPHPKIEYVAHYLDDGITLGTGNANGNIQPGETVFISVDVENIQNVTATSVKGVLTIDPPITGITVIDNTADFPDVDPYSGETSISPHFSIELAEDPTLCKTEIQFKLTMNYMGGTSFYAREHQFSDIVSTAPTVIFFDDMEGSDDNGWIHGMVKTQDDWQRGDPEGRSTDPDDAYSGLNVWGNDIGASGWNGEYQPYVRNHLHSPSIDCSAYSEVYLSFRRWLNVEQGQYDQARIFVNASLIWQNPYSGHVEDDTWLYQEFDISSIAAGKYSVVVVFELETDGGLQMGGWNIDDFSLYTRGCEVFYRSGTPTPTPSASVSPKPTATPIATDTATAVPTATDTSPGKPVPSSSNKNLIFILMVLGMLIWTSAGFGWFRR